MEKAQHQELIKTCKSNLQKLLPDNSQNDHKQKSLNNKCSRRFRELYPLAAGGMSTGNSQ